VKYDEEINAEDASTSHGLVAQLVGSQKRVLDVGCATGRLAEFLERQGNEVWGVELDPQLAELARSRLRTVLVGDVEEVDLVAEFGLASVDVVIFADVLEHLKDPVGALRQARELLAEGGYVVASIPNIAHGASRLALLQGRFDYREEGLLDDTHLRFFTRPTIDGLMRSAGFVITEWQHTTAGPFGTEIPLSPQDFPAEVVAGVEQDPDSRIYQFVVRAVPLGSRAAEEVIAAQLDELAFLRGEFAALARGLADVPGLPVVGVLEAADPHEMTPLVHLRTGVVLAELRRRLAGFAVRVYGIQEQPGDTGLAGEPVQPVLPWNPQRRAQVGAEAEAMVVLAGVEVHPLLKEFVADLGQTTPTVQVLAPDLPSGATGWGAPRPVIAEDPTAVRPPADPLVLVGRLAQPEFLRQRAAYLGLLGRLPNRPGFILVYLTGVDGDDRSRAAQALESLARRAAAALLVIDAEETLGSSVGRTLPSTDLTSTDLVATVGSAGLVITNSSSLLAVASGLGRPAFGVAGRQNTSVSSTTRTSGDDQLLDRLDELVTLAPAVMTDSQVEHRRDQTAGSLDLWFDDLAGELLPAGVRQLRTSAPARVAELAEQVRTLESVNAGLRKRLAHERTFISNYVRGIVKGDHPDSDTATYSGGSERALQDFRSGQAEIERLQKEIAAIYATRTMRSLQPLRGLYARLRSRLR
jgi:2-polyprenyl-3-methyl-5-hydroxy-6-metoxy-1,4-benzoquinol methylase